MINRFLSFCWLHPHPPPVACVILCYSLFFPFFLPPSLSLSFSRTLFWSISPPSPLYLPDSFRRSALRELTSSSTPTHKHLPPWSEDNKPICIYWTSVSLKHSSVPCKPSNFLSKLFDLAPAHSELEMKESLNCWSRNQCISGNGSPTSTRLHKSRWEARCPWVDEKHVWRTTDVRLQGDVAVGAPTQHTNPPLAPHTHICSSRVKCRPGTCFSTVQPISRASLDWSMEWMDRFIWTERARRKTQIFSRDRWISPLRHHNSRKGVHISCGVTRCETDMMLGSLLNVCSFSFLLHLSFSLSLCLCVWTLHLSRGFPVQMHIYQSSQKRVCWPATVETIGNVYETNENDVLFELTTTCELMWRLTRVRLVNTLKGSLDIWGSLWSR